MPLITHATVDRVQLWWHGQRSPPPISEGSGLVFLNHYRRHWTSTAAHAALEYFEEHHRWIIGLLFGLLVAMLVKAH
jgi:hypothetical protein